MTNKIARIENFFVENAQYLLSTREQKIILYLAANLDLGKEDFNEQVVPVRELEQVLKRHTAKWGGIYSEMSDFAERIVSKKIKFPTNILLNGQALPGFVTWFSSIVPCHNESDDVCIKFRFNPDLKPFLLKLNQYVRINLDEVSGLESFYSLRFYQIFKANLAKQSKHAKTVTKVYELAELRQLFGAKKKYEEFKYFNRDILTKATEEINDKTGLFVRYETIRTKRKVTHIKFLFCHKEDYKEYKQLSFLESDPISDENPKRSPGYRKEKAKTYDFAKFKLSYPLVFKQKQREVRDFYRKHKGIKNREQAMEKSLSDLCENWYCEYA